MAPLRLIRAIGQVRAVLVPRVFEAVPSESGVGWRRNAGGDWPLIGVERRP
jgi:hypothetical protein